MFVARWMLGEVVFQANPAMRFGWKVNILISNKRRSYEKSKTYRERNYHRRRC